MFSLFLLALLFGLGLGLAPGEFLGLPQRGLLQGQRRRDFSGLLLSFPGLLRFGEHPRRRRRLRGRDFGKGRGAREGVRLQGASQVELRRPLPRREDASLVRGAPLAGGRSGVAAAAAGARRGEEREGGALVSGSKESSGGNADEARRRSRRFELLLALRCRWGRRNARQRRSGCLEPADDVRASQHATEGQREGLGWVFSF